MKRLHSSLLLAAITTLLMAGCSDDPSTGPDAPEQLAARLAEVTARAGDTVPGSGAAQGALEVQKAMAARG